MLAPRLPSASVSQRLLKSLYGQHILNGVAVAIGIGAVATGMSLALGITAGLTAGLGAICISMGDQPNTVATKVRTLPLAWAFSVTAAVLAALVMTMPWLEGLVILVFGLLSGILLGWGRWALSLSTLTILSIVFTLGAPITSTHQALIYSALFATGGAAYIGIALIITRLLDASDRRLTVSECIRELADYLRAVAGFYDVPVDAGHPGDLQAALYGHVVEHQSSLSDHLQTARALIFVDNPEPDSQRLAAALIVLLDALDAIVSASADLAPLRLVQAGSPLGPRIAELARVLASDLDRLALDLVTGQDHLSMPDRQPMLDGIAEEIAAIDERCNREASGASDMDHRMIRAARMTRSRYAWVAAHLARLPAVLANDEAADVILGEVDLDAFVQPLSYSIGTLVKHLFDPQSPVLRHALRFSLSLAFAYGVIVLVPTLEHSNWILLTIAVILRGSFSVTRQRRNDRLIGTLYGCAIAGALLWIGSSWLILAATLIAVAVSQAFARVYYRVTSTAGCVLGLLSIHLINPTEAPLVYARLIDTLIGISIAYLFSYVLPRWERQDVPEFVQSLLGSTARYARHCLDWNVSLQEYRLARKSLIESLAAISESAARMKGEPKGVRGLWPEYGRLLAASYTTAAQIVTIRLLIRNNRGTLDAARCTALLEETRSMVVATLDPAVPPPLQEETEPLPLEGTTDIFDVLVLRCAQARHAATELRHLCDAQWATST